MNNIEAFNMDNDIGAPLIEGFQNNIQCSDFNQDICESRTDSQGNGCEYVNETCQAKSTDIGAGQDSQTTPCTELDAKECPQGLQDSRCAWDGTKCMDRPSQTTGGAGGANGGGAGFTDYNPEMNTEPSNNEPDMDNRQNDSQDAIEQFYGDYENDGTNNVGGGNSRNLVNVDLLLKSLVYGCVFYILAHPETMAVVRKLFKKISNDNLLLVHMGVFVVVYYVFSLFI